jgi:UDP-N-acetylglucosamine diphosphorylase/glucosamine-1-phosphate N-acetyltransferase
MSASSPLAFLDVAAARRFEPFASTRPLCEVRSGGLLGRERWAAVLGAPASGGGWFVSHDGLADFAEPGSAQAADAVLPAGTILVDSRALPLLPAPPAARSPAASAWMIDGRVAAVRLRAPLAVAQLADGGTGLDALGEVPTGAMAALPGCWLDAVWDLVRTLPLLLPGDIAWAAGDGALSPVPTPDRDGWRLVGSHPVYLEPGARIEPLALLDTTDGPILLRRGAVVQAFTRLSGPAWIGEGSTVSTDRVAVVSLGPQCKVHGELSHTILLGEANKGHDGFVGHSVLGRWSNLGAGTITSNLKNTYGTVALWTPDGVQDTGVQFLGAFIGDHAKTGIGLPLTTGTVIGAGANCTERMPPKRVPAFAWGSGAPYGVHGLEKFLETAERVMARRGAVLDARARAHWTRVHGAATAAD